MRERLKALFAKSGEPLSVIGGYILAALIYTYPLILNFGSYIVGDMESDVWKHLWGFWWVRLKLVDECVPPLYTYLLNYPYGGALWFIDTLNGVLSVPLQSFFTIVETFNLMVIFNLVLAACGAYVLAKGLCGHRGASFCAGLIYAFSAYMGTSITSGITESINIGWMPFFCHYFIRIFRYRRTSDAVMAGVFFSLNTVGCWYFGAFAVLFAVFYYIFIIFGKTGRYGVRALWDLILCFLPKWSDNFLAGLAAVSCICCLAVKSFAAAEHLNGNFIFFRDWAYFSVCPFLTLCAMLAWMQEKPRLGRRLTIIAQGIWASLVTLLIGGLLWRLFNLSWPCSAVKFWALTGAGLILEFMLLVLQIVILYRRSRGAEAADNGDKAVHSLSRKLCGEYLPLMLAVSVLSLTFYALGVSLSAFGTELKNPYNFGNILTAALDLILWGLTLALLRSFCERLKEGEGFVSACCAFCGRRLLLLYALLTLLCLGLNLLAPEFSKETAAILWTVWSAAAAVFLYAFERIMESWEDYCRKRYSRSLNEILWLFYRRFLAKPLIMFAVCLVGILGPTLAFKGTLNADNSIVFRGRDKDSSMVDLHLSREFCNVVNLVDFFIPGKDRAVKSYTVDKIVRACYIGWVPLLLAAYGCIWGRRRKDRGFWLFICGLFMLFAMGPFMYVSESIYSTVKSPLYMLFFNYFPAFSSISIPFRFTMLVMMGAAVLTAYALADILRGWSRRESFMACGAVCLAALFEFMVFSPSPFPLPLSEARLPEYTKMLAESGDSFGLVDYPVQRKKGELLPGEYFFYQLGHKKPIPNRVEGTIPLYVYQNRFTSYLFILEHSSGDLPYRSREDLESAIEDLVRFRLRYIVIHDAYLRLRAREKIHNMLEYYCGAPIFRKDKVCVYKIPEKRH